SIQLLSLWFLGWTLNLFGAFVLLGCYWILGRHFTPELSIHQDHKLVTIGPYAYVRHPSYAAAVFAGVGASMYHLSSDSLVGHMIRRWLPLTFGTDWVVWTSWIFFTSVMVLGLRPKMQREDKMLREAFGDAWERWEKEVPYWIIPGIY
ncbi:hypothetical protein BDN72DRAFT_782467, partial [Pluteus cervinus]